ncbi:Intermembrane phospholipid transport system binding protein MlaD [Candidatus Erwinia haradaeae]|uniref:Intermembrane phospholipid transport system binding protein MlaD n=1 Tax=Candidatus Erwinia haradaeae TaxID=1922217 RepID=A0A451DJ86_9GAMM|nr:outer membrane lipid asymmetry maintenance protein MlaD [Candidatus Erwinia haradaeae]VFP86778.1 Intermembrane phospholipid transport system binding protein MlaD [Candidatus Erwinia haradaeae]
MQTKKNEILVGFFLLLSLSAILFLCLQVSDLHLPFSTLTWKLYATFDNIGDLKIGSPVKIGGVVIGRVTDIKLDPKNYSPRVSMDIKNQYNNIPDTSSLKIRTSGLLGEQYLALNIGFSDPEMGTSMLKDGGTIQDTKSVIMLEDIIGQFLYKNDNADKKHQFSITDTISSRKSKPRLATSNP